MNNFEFQKAASCSAAIAAIKPDAKFIAGGTNLIDLWKYDIEHPRELIDVNELREKSAVVETNNGIRLNAFATNADTAYHPLIETKYPLLSKAILSGASAQIRNMATNGGNLLQRTRCYYFYDTALPCNKRKPGSGCPAIPGYNRMHAILGTSDQCIAVFPSDMCVALAALNATVNVKSASGERSIAFAEFHRLPGNSPERDNNLAADELITSIDIPKKGFAENYSYLKLRDRHSYAFALISVATGLEIADGKIVEARFALGGVAHKPWRSAEAEAFLKEKEVTEENFGAAADLILSGAKGYGKNDFKIPLAKRAIIRNAMMALNPASQGPGAGPSL